MSPLSHIFTAPTHFPPSIFAGTDEVVVDMERILLTWALTIVLGEKIMKCIGHASSQGIEAKI